MLTKSNLEKDIETMINFMRTPKMTKNFNITNPVHVF